MKPFEVAADRHVRNVEVADEVRDADAAVLPDPLEDIGLTLSREQSWSSRPYVGLMSMRHEINRSQQ
jgi:hypothetical protein